MALIKDPIDLGELMISILLFAYVISRFVKICSYYNTFKIFSDRLEISNLGGFYRRTIYFKDIKSFETEWNKDIITYKEEYSIGLKNGQSYTLYEKSYKNYFDLKKNLNQKKIKNTVKKDRLPKRVIFIENVIIICFTCLLVFIPFYLIYQYQYFTLDRNSLVEIPLNLSKKSRIIKRSKGSDGLSISIKEYPKFDFSIYGTAFSATNRVDFIEYTERGNKVYLIFDKEEYQQKLSKEKQVTFFNKYFSYYEIDVYGIRDNKRTYLTLEDYIIQKKSDSYSALLWVFVAILLIFFLMHKEIKDSIFRHQKKRFRKY
jgi:hypothetical protein